MPKTAGKGKKAAKKPATGADEKDPRFLPVAAALARKAGFSLMESASGATRGMMLNGKSFGMSSHGRFVLKLTEERVAELIEDGTGKPFSASAGRTMKGWIEITGEGADWVAFAKEAYGLAVRSGEEKAKKKAGR